ncbi:MAG: hypothetical protein ACTHJW_28740, partial [Streptosporangiaceae bacterium]
MKTTKPAGFGARHARAGARSTGPWIGRTGIRLALLIVIICLAAIGTILAIAGATVAADVDRLQAEQSADLARALALAASLAHTPAGWERSNLTPVIDLIARSGAAAEIHSRSGRLIRSSPGYARYKSSLTQHVPVVAGGKQVGSVALRLDHKGLGEDIARYQTLRWHVMIAAAVAALLIAVTVSLLVSRRLT